MKPCDTTTPLSDKNMIRDQRVPPLGSGILYVIDGAQEMNQFNPAHTDFWFLDFAILSAKSPDQHAADSASWDAALQNHLKSLPPMSRPPHLWDLRGPLLSIFLFRVAMNYVCAEDTHDNNAKFDFYYVDLFMAADAKYRGYRLTFDDFLLTGLPAKHAEYDKYVDGYLDNTSWENRLRIFMCFLSGVFEASLEAGVATLPHAGIHRHHDHDGGLLSPQMFEDLTDPRKRALHLASASGLFFWDRSKSSAILSKSLRFGVFLDSGMISVLNPDSLPRKDVKARYQEIADKLWVSEHRGSVTQEELNRYASEIATLKELDQQLDHLWGIVRAWNMPEWLSSVDMGGSVKNLDSLASFWSGVPALLDAWGSPSDGETQADLSSRGFLHHVCDQFAFAVEVVEAGYELWFLGQSDYAGAALIGLHNVSKNLSASRAFGHPVYRAGEKGVGKHFSVEDFVYIYGASYKMHPSQSRQGRLMNSMVLSGTPDILGRGFDGDQFDDVFHRIGPLRPYCHRDFEELTVSEFCRKIGGLSYRSTLYAQDGSAREDVDHPPMFNDAQVMAAVSATEAEEQIPWGQIAELGPLPEAFFAKSLASKVFMGGFALQGDAVAQGCESGVFTNLKYKESSSVSNLSLVLAAEVSIAINRMKKKIKFVEGWMDALGARGGACSIDLQAPSYLCLPYTPKAGDAPDAHPILDLRDFCADVSEGAVDGKAPSLRPDQYRKALAIAAEARWSSNLRATSWYGHVLRLRNSQSPAMVTSKAINMLWETRLVMVDGRPSSSTPCFRKTTAAYVMAKTPQLLHRRFSPRLMSEGHNSFRMIENALTRSLVARQIRMARRIGRDLKAMGFKTYTLDLGFTDVKGFEGQALSNAVARVDELVGEEKEAMIRDILNTVTPVVVELNSASNLGAYQLNWRPVVKDMARMAQRMIIKRKVCNILQRLADSSDSEG